MSPVVIWPVAASVWAGGWVAAARRTYVRWRDEPDPNDRFTRNESMGLAIFWPIWVPLMYLGKAVRAGWQLAARGIFGDL